MRARRAHLVARAASQRDRIARGLSAWTGLADRGRTWIDGLKQEGASLGVALGVSIVSFLVSRRRSGTGLLRRGAAGRRPGSS